MPPVARLDHAKGLFLSQRKELGLTLLLLSVTLLAYWPALHGDMLVDDDSHVTQPTLRSLHGLWQIWTEPGLTHQYYPFLHTVFWAEFQLWGTSVFGYHLANVVQHVAAAYLLVLILEHLFCFNAAARFSPGTAWLAGFIFALHPVCVESVAWISEQKNTLSTFLALAAVLVYLRFQKNRTVGNYAGASGLFLLAILSKSMVITLPCVLLVIFWWQNGGLDWRRDVFPLVPWMVIGVAVTVPVMRLEKQTWSNYDFAAEITLTFLQRLLLAGRAFWFYLSKLILPVDLAFIYPRWAISESFSWQYLYPGSALMLAFICLKMVRHNRGPLATLLLFAGMLFPVAGFFNVFWFAFSYVGDHLQYFPALVAIASFSAALAIFGEKLPVKFNRFAPAVSVALVITLGVLTWRQSQLYQNAEALYRATLAKNPASWIAHYNLGTELNHAPNHQAEAIVEWETALRLRPDFAIGHCNLACALANNPANIDKAIQHLEMALRLKPNFADAHSNLAVIFANDPARIPEAIEHFKAALQLDPNSPEIHNNYGNLLIDIPGQLPEAIRQIEIAVRLRPDYAEAHWNLGVALAQSPGHLKEAIAQVESALRLKPDFPQGAEMLQHLKALSQ